MLFRQWRSSAAGASAVFVLGFCIAVAAGQRLQRDLDAPAQAAFERSVERVADEVVQRFHRPIRGLNGAKGMVAARQRISRAEFRAFFAAQDLARDYPGVRGFGFIQRVIRDDVDRFIAAERADGEPTFAIRQLVDKDLDDLYIVKFNEPPLPNSGALGLDLGSEARRRATVQRSVDSGEPTLSAAITLVQDQRRSPGVVLYVPAYAQGASVATVNERRAALLGLMSAPIVIAELLDGVRDGVDGQVDFDLFELSANAGASAGSPVYEAGERLTDSAFGTDPVWARRFRGTRTLSLPGRDYLLRVAATPQFEAAHASPTPWLVFGCGVAISAMLALLLWQQSSRRRRAESMARRMTVELERLAEVVKHTSNAVTITDRELRITWVNEGFTRISGYTPAEALGKTPGDLLGSGKADPAVLQTLAQSADAGTACRVEILNRAKDGREYWIDAEIQPQHDAQGRLTGFMEIGSDVTATKRAELALARERFSLANIIEGTNVGTWEWNLETGENRFNERWAQMIGYTVGELSPCTVETWQRLLHPDDRAHAVDRCDRHLSGGLPGYECEFRLRHKDGQWVWVHSRGKVLNRNEAGAPLLMAGMHMDISERKRAEAALRASQTFLDKAGRIAGVGGWAYDLATREILWTDETCRIHDCAPGHQPSFEEHLSYYAPQARPAVDRAFKLCMSQGESVDLELPMVTAAGRAIWVHAVGEVEFAAGKPARIIGALQDITARHELEAEVRRASGLLRGSIDALDDAFALYDPEDRLVVCNQRYRDLYSLCADIIVPGASFESIIRAGAERGQYPAAAGRVDAWVAERLALHRSPSSQLQQRLADGRVLRIIEKRMPDGHTVGVRVDITELVRATEAAEEASRAKTQFLANVSHEIRTPMSAVLGMLTLLQRSPLAPAQLDYATKAQGAASSLLRLLNDILDFSKTEQGMTKLDAQPFRMATLLGEVQALAAGLVEGKGLAVQFNVDPALPHELVGDPMRLQQVLVNLVGNAVKFTERGTVNVHVRVCERAPTAVTLEFAVVDTGIGIAEGDLQRIFNAFTQAEASTTRRFGGTGLGLSISQRLVRLMGGEIGVESVLGKGSRFHFRIALAVAQSDDIAQPAPAALAFAALAPALPCAATRKPQRLAGLRILIVEDNADIQLISGELLSQEGALTQLANHGQAALDRLAADARFDAVLMDLQMPVMDGLTAAGHIRGRLGLTELPIIAVSANAMASDRQACLAAGMNDHVGKPFDSSDLVRVLLRHTGRREAAAPKAPTEPAGPQMLSEALCDAAARADVDIRAALKRLGSGTSVYGRLLRKFRSELEALPERLRALLAQRDTGGAALALHSLKGLAATLGAMRLSDTAAQSETQLMTPQAANAARLAVESACEAIAAARPGLGVLWHALQSELDSGAPRAPAATPAAAEGSPRQRAAAHESLRRLERLLGESDMEALRAMEGLRRDFGSVFGDALNPVDQATQALDFVRARQLCRELDQATLEGHAA